MNDPLLNSITFWWMIFFELRYAFRRRSLFLLLGSPYIMFQSFKFPHSLHPFFQEKGLNRHNFLFANLVVLTWTVGALMLWNRAQRYLLHTSVGVDEDFMHCLSVYCFFGDKERRLFESSLNVYFCVLIILILWFV